VGLLFGVLIAGLASIGFAKDLTSTGLEEAFIDAVGTCGPSSSVAGALGKSSDPSVRQALRNALIIEAADDAAAPGGSTHPDCIQKDLTSRGYTQDQMAALPGCVRQDWPDPFTSLGSCVQSHGKIEATTKKK